MQTISVVIPTLNASGTIDKTLREIVSLYPALIREVIISDGGSTDDTVDKANRAGCLVTKGARGRGLQLARGGALACGDWLLFLHADTRLSQGWADEVFSFIHGVGSEQVAATFTFALDDPALKARILERLVAGRVKLLALPYGDQGLLIHRELYRDLGGYRPYPLMEDVDLIRRIGRYRLKVLNGKAITSAARYQHRGFARRIARNILCITLYFVGVAPRLIVKLYG